ncbi:hypothetical protein R1sor_010542 [Riccia sorocarpa]|uniref:Uncharacterized protein n=1 Tax=Riccia sorocarpa TaxID=122646 RepID=A0ABD3HZR4_9MARC
MSANLMTPSLRTAKRNKAEFVPFLPGVQPQNFAEVSKILEASKRHYGIVGDVPVILAEDETRIKPRVRWESRRDTLIGFCGPEDAHTCRLGLEVTVGSGVLFLSLVAAMVNARQPYCVWSYPGLVREEHGELGVLD